MATPTIYKTTSTSPDLSRPRGLAVDTDRHRLLICDASNNQLVLCNLDGVKQISTHTTWGTSSARTWSSPSDAVYHKGYFYVLDTGHHILVRIRARDMQDKDTFGTYNSSGSTNTKLSSPEGITTDGEYLYVADTGNNRLMKITLKTLAYKAKAGTINGSVSAPKGILYKRWGGEALFFTESTRIVKCQTDFTYIEQTTTGVSSPLHMIHFNDMVHVANGDNSIVVLASDGLAVQTTYADSSVTLSTPYGIALYRNAMYISDNGNDRVTIWKTYDPRDAFTPSTPAKFGGEFFDEPIWIVDQDVVIAGATQEA